MINLIISFYNKLLALSVGLTKRCLYHQKSVLGMKLNCIWWWDSICETLGRVEYLLVSKYHSQIHSDQSDSICLGPIYEMNEYI